MDSRAITRLLLIASIGLTVSGLLFFGIYLLAEPQNKICIILALINLLLANLFYLLRRQERTTIFENKRKGNESNHVSL